MTAKSTWLLAVALALVSILGVWAASPAREGSPSAATSTVDLGGEKVSEATGAPPRTVVSDPRPLAVSPEARAPVEAAGLTIQVFSRRLRSSGASGPPRSVATPVAASLQLGVSNARWVEGDPLLEFETGPEGETHVRLPASALPPATEGQRP